jgi:hypothetical protein
MSKNLHFAHLATACLLLGAASAQAQSTLALAPPVQAPTSATPLAMNYQGIAREADGKPLQNKTVSLRISVLAGGADGPVAYAETHKVTTTEQGSFSLAIGRGKTAQGAFSTIAWGSSNHFLRIEMDPAGGTNFKAMGTSELLSVPYALFAGTASKVQSGASGGAETTNGATPGVPGQVWSLFGNSRVNPLTDRLGTTDAADLVLITNNLDRLTITRHGNVAIRNDLGVGNDLTVNRNVYLNTTSGATVNNGPLTVANASPTALSGTLNVTGATNLASTLNTEGATTLRSTLGVTGATNLLSTLNTEGATTLRSTLGVTGATNLLNTLNTEGATTLRSTLGVTGATSLQNTLGVSGPTTLGSTLGVAGATSLASTLNTMGATTLRSSLGVDGPTNLGNTLNTVGATTLRSTLGVTGASTLGSTLTVAGATTLNNSLAANGQVTIRTNLGANQGSYAAYPLRVEGSGQGLAIKLNAGTPNNDNNFITFFNSSGSAVGRIEGETSGEATSTPEFIFRQFDFGSRRGQSNSQPDSSGHPGGSGGRWGVGGPLRRVHCHGPSRPCPGNCQPCGLQHLCCGKPGGNVPVRLG